MFNTDMYIFYSRIYFFRCVIFFQPLVMNKDFHNEDLHDDDGVPFSATG